MCFYFCSNLDLTMVTLKDIASAHDRIRPFIHRTTVMTNNSLDQLSGSKLFFKCDNFQKSGAFKIRGATNTVELLQKEINTLGNNFRGDHIILGLLEQGLNISFILFNSEIPKLPSISIIL